MNLFREMFRGEETTVSIEGQVLRCGFTSFLGEAGSDNQIALLIKTNTGVQLIQCRVPKQYKTKFALTSAGDQVKMVAKTCQLPRPKSRGLSRNV